MSEAKRYIARAEQLEQIAKESLVAEHTARLLEIAAEWRRLAAQVERMEARSWSPKADPRSPSSDG